MVAPGIGSVMRLSSSSCRLSLDVRITAFDVAMVLACLAVSKVVSIYSALMRWLHTSRLAGESLVFVYRRDVHLSGKGVAERGTKIS